MAAVNAVPCISPHKNILQQTNNNVPVTEDKKDNQKQLERNIIILRRKRKTSPEDENRLEPEPVPEKNEKSDIIKLRSVRLMDISSQKLGVIRNVQSKLEIKSENESSDDDFKKKPSKPRPIVPNYVTNADKGPYRKPRQYKRDDLDLSSQSLRVTKPQSLSIARRNARERNRVKQVNQGFATLRSRIPDYISEVYNEEKGRKNTKKLSKVETLRMAVDYIKHLETMLDFKSDESSQWLNSVKTENLSWNTSNSSNGYPSPVDTEYQQSCIDSPNAPYDQSYSLSERPFYDYEFELQSMKDLIPLKPGKTDDEFLSSTKLSSNILILNDEEDFVSSEKYELFDKIKKEDYVEYRLEYVPKENEEKESEDKFDSDVEMDLSKKKEEDRSDDNNSPLPPINETFPNRNLSVFYDSRSFGT